MATEDFMLVVLTFVSIMTFIIAVLYERTKYISTDMEDVHMAAVVAPFTLVLASMESSKPEFVVIGLCIFAVVAAYYFLTECKDL